MEYLKDAEVYFKKKAGQWLAALSLGEYIRQASDCVRAEEDRITRYMHPKTSKKMRLLFNKEVLVNDSKSLLQKDKGLGNLLRSNAIPVSLS